MKRLRLAGALALVAGLGLSACSPAPTEASARAELEKRASAMDAVAQDLLRLIKEDGLTAVAGGSHIDVCQSEPAPGLAYRAGVEVRVGATPAVEFADLTESLVANGWVRSGDTLGGTATTPTARFTRDGFTADVKTGGFTIGQKRYKADAMSVALTHESYCTRVPDGGYGAEVEDLEKDYVPAP